LANSAFHLPLAAAARNPMLQSAIEDARAAMFLMADAIGFDVVLDTSLNSDEQKAERSPAEHIEIRRELYDVVRKEGIAP